jgi:hypothetical protein
MALRDMAEQSPKMKITIGIPCYNAERWIRQAIQSALEQRGVEPEVIVVDDGSTDSSRAAVREFSGSVRLIEGGHRGANHARNLILKNATGEWVQYLDADDYLEPQKISTQLKEARGETDVIYSPVWIETTTAAKTTREQSRTSPEEDIFTQWIRWHIPQTGGALWRREPLRKLSWREEQPCCQEHELYLAALQAGLRFEYTPTPGAVYRIWSEETLCRKDPVLVTRVRTGLMERMLDWLKQEGKFKPQHRREIAQACFEMARTWARFNLAEATKYHDQRRAKGLIHLAGPAAPWKYRIAYHFLGFARAEKLASATR